MPPKLTLQQLAEALEKYAELESSEMGDTLTALIRLSRYADHISEALTTALQIEMKEQLDWLQEHSVIEEKVIQAARTIQVLRFLD